jgi:hypothetical protein
MSVVIDSVSAQLTINRMSACLKRCRHSGLTDSDTATALLAVIDSAETDEAGNQDDLATCQRIAHGMARGDKLYCLAELKKAKGKTWRPKNEPL